ncbi:MAG: B-box zinc finger protein [Deltaproteobacteria bacterium]|nr:B-box zinc finger protein [Deltaproteobacteria bacterium]MBW2116698.1 B-box zinc finger protein [Deltaproteobacteria bacterium]MBW2344020.1 B-box zinc finger protein [Deltaproteobacteria bacterium]
MQCKHHPDRKATHICSSCNAPLCEDCAEEIRVGVYSCFQCAMLHSVSAVGTGLTEKQAKAVEKRAKKKKKWGPFQYFLTVSSTLILVMWMVIIFGGQKAPEKSGVVLERGKANRVLLFLVDGALKRYAHYEGNRYPDTLTDLVPQYLQMRKDQTQILGRLSYIKVPGTGYELSIANPRTGDMSLILTPKGVKYAQPSGGESS